MKKHGFTLMEIMFAVSIIALLAGVSTIGVSKMVQLSRVKRAEAELQMIATAVLRLAWDTGKWPNGDWRHKNSDTEEWDLETTPLVRASTNFSGWNGPYYTGPFVDPWAKGRNDKIHRYFFDPDYYTNGVRRAAVGSFGPTGTGKTAYDANNIIVLVDDIKSREVGSGN